MLSIFLKSLLIFTTNHSIKISFILMNKKEIIIEDSFVLTLFSNSTFRKELTRFHNKQTTNSFHQINQQQPIIIDDICQLLVQSYRQTVDQQTLAIYQTFTQFNKEIQTIKTKLMSFQTKQSEYSTAEKQKQPDLSLFSEVSIDWQKEPQRLKKTAYHSEQKTNRVQQASFMGSLLYDTGAKQLRQEIEEKLKSSVLNLSGDMAKFETGIEQRFKNLEHSINKKIENIFKTLSNVFETINELQSKSGQLSRQLPKNALEKLFDSKKLPAKGSKEDRSQIQNKDSNRRRSFLGFTY